MKLLMISALPLFVAVVALCGASAQEQMPLAHTRTQFSFTIDAPFAKVAPLFGANEERKWSSDWNPQFVYPVPARDEEGMVFKIAHGSHSSIWVNTALDLSAGHIQYAYVLSEAMATLIDIRLTREGPAKTGITVVYERTALIPEANDHVQHFAKGDEGAGKEWGDAMSAYFAKSHTTAAPKR